MISHEEIARLAYELYEKSGRVPGRDLENWFEAERILRQRYGNGGGSRGGNGEEAKAAAKKKAPAHAGVKKAGSRKATAKKTTKKRVETE
ncbi:MAG: DUF2934 domain-containing protein [Nitrospirota bacterium]